MAKKNVAIESYTVPLPWLRLWTDFVHDPKVQMLPEAMRHRYVMLLCYTGLRLIPTDDDAAVGYALRLSVKETQRTKAALIKAKLIGKDWKPVAWERRQFVSDHSGAERQKRYRDKHRDSNVTVTAASRDGDDIEGEEEEKKNQKQRREKEGTERDAEGKRASSPQADDSQLAQSSSDRKALVRDVLKDGLPPMKSHSPGVRKNGDFEQINTAVEKLITQKICTPEDYDGIARIACITPAQARTSIQQLINRGRI